MDSASIQDTNSPRQSLQNPKAQPATLAQTNNIDDHRCTRLQGVHEVMGPRVVSPSPDGHGIVLTVMLLLLGMVATAQARVLAPVHVLRMANCKMQVLVYK